MQRGVYREAARAFAPARPLGFGAGQRGPTPPQATPSIRVVSYNLLAQKYAEGGWHNYCPTEYLAWPRRLALIQEELQSYAADLVCLQEVEDAVFHEQLAPWFKSSLGMQGWFMARQSGDVPGPPEGVALFALDTVFAAQQVRFVRLADHSPALADAAWTGGEAWRVFTQRQECAILALLEHKPTGRTLLAASTHLFWNPKYPDVKALQAAVLCEQLAAMACAAATASGRKTRAPPIVVGGDFNSLPCKRKPDVFDRMVPDAPDGLVSGVYTLLSTGVLPASHPDHPAARLTLRETGSAGSGGTEAVSGRGSHAVPSASDRPAQPVPPLQAHGLRLSSTHKLALGREPVFTTKTPSFAGCLDYVWVTDGAFHVDSILALPEEAHPSSYSSSAIDPLLDTPGFSPIPDATYPSDHLAVGCALTFAESCTAPGG